MYNKCIMSLTKKENTILESIKVASENNPDKPEFPADDPRFPATPTYKINVPGFENVWIKDESFNPTGTHKDRMAWELVVTYRDFLIAKKNDQKRRSLPRMSIISSGSAAFAIQTQFKKYKLPALKVLVDKKIRKEIVKSLESVGCELYKTDLSKGVLNWEEILKLTKNLHGIDITSSEALDPATSFYDWLSYEVINSSPDYCFVPFGTGHLYENILNVNRKEVSGKKHDPRFKGRVRTLRNCNFFGATTDDPRSKAEKLYSPHLPFVHFGEHWIRHYRYASFCGNESDVFVLKEKYLDQAVKLAEKQGITCEPSGIAGLGLLLQMKKSILRNKKILIVNTGKVKYLENISG